jgi:hypothetical protein
VAGLLPAFTFRIVFFAYGARRRRVAASSLALLKVWGGGAYSLFF